MTEKVLEYQGRRLRVHYAVARCIHAAECVRGLPDVFDPQRKPWVEVDAADPEQVAAVIERCPTGALTYEMLDGSAGEVPDPVSVAHIAADGPVYLRGDIQLADEAGGESNYSRLALCRCGASEHKPFCDGNHAKAGFSDPGAMTVGTEDPAKAAATGGVSLRCNPDGPVTFQGCLAVEAADGARQILEQGALCRCGASASKPFCDGSHRKVGFRSG